MQTNNQQRSSQIIKNVLMNGAAFAATIGIGFVMSPFLVRHLGDSIYGVWVLVGSLVGYLGLLDFGITPSTVKYIAEYRALNNQAAINRLVTTSLTIYAVIGCVTLIVSAIVAVFFNRIFATPLSFTTAAAVVLITGLNLALTFPAAVFVGIIRGYQRYDLDSKITTINILIRSGLIVFLILKGYGILSLAIVTFAFDMWRLVYLIGCAYRLNPDIKIKREYFDRAQMRTLFGYSVFAFLMIIGKKLIFYTDAIVIGIFMPLAAVTLYSVANRLVTYLLQVSETLGVLTPAASDMAARNDHLAIKETLILSTKYMLLMALPVAAVFFVLGDAFITLWMGPEYASSAVILSILTVSVLAHLLEMPAHTLLLGLGKHKIVAKFTLAQALVNLALSLALVKPYGLKGVALGTTVPMVAFTFIALFIYVKNYLHIPVGEYLRRSMPLALLIQAPLVGLLLVIRFYQQPAALLERYSRTTSLLIFFAAILAALIPYGVLVFLFCMNRSERLAVLKIADKFGLKLSPRFS
ncbi:MAG: flippase [Acidobacteria bacterium]|nr:flippase [Acidobacteriota bacterium]